jgi:hypothetical protein
MRAVFLPLGHPSPGETTSERPDVPPRRALDRKVSSGLVKVKPITVPLPGRGSNLNSLPGAFGLRLDLPLKAKEGK